MEKVYDIAVIGLGAMGSASVYQSALKNANVIGFDTFHPPHSLGSTHGGSRITRQTYFEGQEYIPLLKYSYDLWKKIEKETGNKILQITGGLMLGERYSSIIEKCIQSAKMYNLPYQFFDPIQLKNKFPGLKTGTQTYAILDENAGILNPELGLQSQLGLAEKLGAKLKFNEKILSWKVNEKSGLVELNSKHGSYFASKLIITVGPWAIDYLKPFKIEIKPERIVQFWMKPKNGIKNFKPNVFPIFIWTVEKNLDLYGFPAIDGENGGIKVAFYPHNTHQIREYSHPDYIDREIKSEEINIMKDFLRKYIPDLDTEPIKTITCMHVNSPDGHPIISQHPEHNQVFYGVGFSGHGFKFSNVVGDILSDLAIKGKSSFNLNLFDINRFKKQAP